MPIARRFVSSCVEERASDVPPLEPRIDADRVHDRDRLGKPELAVVEAAEEEAGRRIRRSRRASEIRMPDSRVASAIFFSKYSRRWPADELRVDAHDRVQVGRDELAHEHVLEAGHSGSLADSRSLRLMAALLAFACRSQVLASVDPEHLARDVPRERRSRGKGSGRRRLRGARRGRARTPPAAAARAASGRSRVIARIGEARRHDVHPDPEAAELPRGGLREPDRGRPCWRSSSTARTCPRSPLIDATSTIDRRRRPRA